MSRTSPTPGTTPADNLAYLAVAGVTPDGLLLGQALAEMIFGAELPALGSVSTGIREPLVQKILEVLWDVAAVTRDRARIEHAGARRPRGTTVCLAAAATELLLLNTSVDTFEKVRRAVYQDDEWEEKVKSKEFQNTTSLRRRQLEAAIWIGVRDKSMRNAPYKAGVFDAFATVINDYLDTEGRRAGLREFAVSHLQQARPDPIVVSTPMRPVVALPEPPAKSPGNQDERGRCIVDPQLQRTIDELADVVRRQWQDEKRRRERHDFLLPVRWTNAPREYADHPVNIGGTSDQGIEPVLLDGTINNIADTLSIPSGRLVVLGQGGAGKTTAAIALLLALLAPERRSSGEPVPMIFSLASWRPDRETLEGWMEARLAAEYPALKVTVARKVTLASQLVRGQHLLPILDGFDEIPLELRDTAIRVLNRYGDRFVLTSRTDEYFEAIDENGILTYNAAVIELQDLTLDDIADYLPRTARLLPAEDDNNTKWDPVLSRMRPGSRDTQGAMLLDVFATPLMVSLARVVYSDTAADPMDLLEAELFPDAGVVSDYLVDNFVRIRYDDLPQDTTDQRRKSWQSDDAQRWLGYLAVRLHAMGTRNLTWWRIRTDKFDAVLAILGIVIFGIGGVGLFTLIGPAHDLGRYSPVMAFTCWYFIIIGIGLGMAPRSLPRRLRLSLRHVRKLGLPDSERAGEFAFVGVSIFGGLMLFVVTTPALRTGVSLQVVPPAAALMIVMPLTLIILLTNPPGLTRVISPTSLLRSDLVAGLVRGVLYGISYAIFVSVLFFVGDQTPWLPGVPLVVIATIIGTMLGSASGQWLVSRAWLAAHKRLPWRAMVFLEDAHRRGVLRQIGGEYQFRHAFVQDRLARWALLERGALGSRSSLLRARMNLANEFQHSGRFDIAEFDLRDLLDLQRRSWRADHFQILLTWYSLIVSLQERGEIGQARTEMKALRDVQHRSVDHGWWSRVRGSKRFIALLRALNGGREAEVAKLATFLDDLEQELNLPEPEARR